jgi:hypothetical protein
MSLPELPPHLEQLTAALADRYTLERKLGEGGMATVYLAHDIKHNRKVALKVLKPELAAALGAQRFLQEIQVTANLHHPHILSLYDSGNAEGALFYVMPLVRGDGANAAMQFTMGGANRLSPVPLTPRPSHRSLPSVHDRSRDSRTGMRPRHPRPARISSRRRAPR